MAIFIKPFYGVPRDALYPQWFHVGSECPLELEAAASAADALQPEKGLEQPKQREEEKPLNAPSAAKKR